MWQVQAPSDRWQVAPPEPGQGHLPVLAPGRHQAEGPGDEEDEEPPRRLVYHPSHPGHQGGGVAREVPVTSKPLVQWEAAGLTQGDDRYSTPLLPIALLKLCLLPQSTVSYFLLLPLKA